MPDASIAFLGGLPDEIGDEPLRQAMVDAARDGVGADLALLSRGEISESLFYRRLSLHLDIVFLEGWPRVASRVDVATIQRRRGIRLADGRWLLAPSGDLLRRLVLAGRSGSLVRDRLCLTTPAHLAALARLRSAGDVGRRASRDLVERRPDLSALAVLDWKAAAVLCCPVIACACAIIGQTVAIDLVDLVFLASLIFRSIVYAAGYEIRPPRRDLLAPSQAPFYTVLVPLYREAHMVAGLVAALERLEYPRSKLEVLFLIEADDGATREALHRIAKPPCFHIVLVPEGHPRTKPRALNVGLAVASGMLVTVYDAEDKPDADQLRRAAARFAGAAPTLACVQARLRIDNGAKAWLAGLFALEYAVLFELTNVGFARLGLPMALGGTSNHFRMEALRAVGGWDAWNVTEDADLGLRLARFGYSIDILDSTTWEEAPITVATWFRQRRRWTKGWLQTFLVLAKGGRRTCADLGGWHTAAVALMLVNLVLGPLVSPVFMGFVCLHLIRDGTPTPRGGFQVAEATMAFSLIVLWIGSTLWCASVGLRRVGERPWLMPFVLFLPYQLMISAAAWGGLCDLITAPYYWHKTDHFGD